MPEVHMWWTCGSQVSYALLPLSSPTRWGEKLAPSPWGGAEEGPVRWGHRRREGFAAVAVTVAAAAAAA